MNSKNVYITQISALSSLGNGLTESLQSLEDARVNLTVPGENDRYNRPYFPVDQLDDSSGAIRCSRLIFKTLSHLNKENLEAVPLFLGSSTGGIYDSELHFEEISANLPTSYSLYSQFFDRMYHDISREFPGLFKRGISFSTACTSSGHALLHAYRSVKAGLIPRALVIGVDSLSLTTMIGFDSLKLVSEKGTNPLSLERDGLSLGEGAGFLLLESAPSGPVLAEITGAASNSDGYHISSPNPEGTSQKKCILAALEEARIEKEQIDYINAHGTGTRINDEVEMKVIGELFSHNPPVTSLKGFTGHTLGASTVLEIALVLGMTGQQRIYQYPQLVSPINPALVPLQTVSKKTGCFLKNSFGFGGNNVSLVIQSKV